MDFILIGYAASLIVLLAVTYLLNKKKTELSMENAILKEHSTQLQTLQFRYDELNTKYIESEALRREAVVALEKEVSAFEDKISSMKDVQQRFMTEFKALSATALQENNKSFLDLAKTSFEKVQSEATEKLSQKHQAVVDLMQPVQTALKDVAQHIQEIEKNRVGAYEGLKQQVLSLTETQKSLHQETANLVKALRAPTVRGQWGEMQLKRVVEMAGMVNYCDFIEQASVDGENGKLRPDMVINLPGHKKVVVDAKAPLSAYLAALDTENEDERTALLKQHASLVRKHIKTLSSKSYWENLGEAQAVEFVVLFLPGEVFFSAALEQDPELIEIGVAEKVILATPTTLISLLRAISYGWRQEKLTENAMEVGKLGKEIYKRLSDMSVHISKLGRHISASVDAYNQTIGTFERRVLVSARKFQDLEIVEQNNQNFIDVSSVDKTIKGLNSPELLSTKEQES